MLHLGYFCQYCDKFIQPFINVFKHPEFVEKKTALVCRKCGTHVFVKENKAIA